MGARDYWEEHARTWRGFPGVGGLRPAALVSRFLAGRQAAIERLLADCAGTGTLLDVGCGSGEALAIFRSRVARAVGVDASRPMLELARGRGGLVQADAHHLPIRDASCDIVLASGLLDYVADAGAVIAELARVTRPGGRVLLTYPQHPSPFGLLRQGWGARLRWLLFRLPPVRNTATWRELAAALSAAGLTPRAHRSLWGASWLVESRALLSNGGRAIVQSPRT